MDKSNIVTLNNGNFRDITSTNNKLVMVDFWADWCAPCRLIAPMLEMLADEYPEELLIGKLNIDDQRDIAMEFGIASIPTIHLYKAGALMETLIGSRPYHELKAAVDKHI